MKRYIIKILAFIILFFGIHGVLEFCLVDDSGSYTRITLHEMYTQKENIDVLFLGASHCYRSFDTGITDNIFGMNTFNAGSSLQPLDGSLALLKEAGKENKFKKVYVEIVYTITGETNKDRTDMTPTYIISDYMNPSINRLLYILQASDNKYYFNGFLKERRYISSLPQIGDTIKKKMTDAYKNYDYVDNGIEKYEGKGYVYSSQEVGKGKFLAKSDFGEISDNILSLDDKKYIQKIIEYCEENNIELTFVSAPMPNFKLVNTGNYDKYVKIIKKLIANTNATYYDFNLCKESMLDLSGEDFMDVGHLNGNGAEKFSTVFSKFFIGEISKDELFWNSYQEKINNEPGRVFGLIVKKLDKGNNYKIEPVKSSKMNLVYTVSKIDSNGKRTLLQEKSINTMVVLPDNESGTLDITVFNRDSDEETNHVKCEFKKLMYK